MSDERETPAADEQAQSEQEQDTGPFFQMPPPRPETSEMDALDPTAVAAPHEEHAEDEHEADAVEPEPAADEAPVEAEPEFTPPEAEPDAEVPAEPAVEPEPAAEAPESPPEPEPVPGPEPVSEPDSVPDPEPPEPAPETIPVPSEPDPVPTPLVQPEPVSEPEPIVAAASPASAGAVEPVIDPPAFESSAGTGAGNAPSGHPEILVGLSFAGGIALAILLKRLAT